MPCVSACSICEEALQAARLRQLHQGSPAKPGPEPFGQPLVSRKRATHLMHSERRLSSQPCQPKPPKAGSQGGGGQRRGNGGSLKRVTRNAGLPPVAWRGANNARRELGRELGLRDQIDAGREDLYLDQGQRINFVPLPPGRLPPRPRVAARSRPAPHKGKHT